MTVLIDSGAYSIRRAKKKIDTKAYLSAYIRYCRDNAAHVEMPVSLDVIQGTVGPDGKPMSAAAAAKAGFYNWEQMRAANVDAMPVFHAGEPWEWLDRYAAAGCRWIGLASARAGSLPRRRAWLRACFRLLSKYESKCLIRTHGFAETELSIVTGFSWYSVDSTVATKNAAYGQIFMPTRNRDGDWILGLYFIGDTDSRTHASHQLGAQAPGVRDVIEERVEKHGLTIAQLSEKELPHRARYNAVEYERFVREHAVNPAVRIFHATSPSLSRDPFRGEAVPRDRLLSYYFLRGGKFDVAGYARSVS